MSAILDFSSILFSAKGSAASFLEINRCVLTASNKNMINNRVQKKKLEQFFVKKLQFSNLVQTLICIIKFAQIHKMTSSN